MSTMGNMAGRDMDSCLDSRGFVDPMDGVNYQGYMKKGCKTSHIVMAEHDKWNGKRTNSIFLECLMAIYLLYNAHMYRFVYGAAAISPTWWLDHWVHL